MPALRFDFEAFRIPRPRTRMRRQLQPDAVRMFYAASLRPFLARMHALVAQELVPVLQEALPIRQDTSEDERIKAVLDRIAVQFAREMPPRKIRALAEEAFNRTSGFQKAQLLEQLKSALGFDPLLADRGLEALAKEFVARNVDLIKTVPERYFSEVRDLALEAVRKGRRAVDVASDIEDRYGVAESNAIRVANDQIGKAFGALNKERMTELGVERFVWRTTGDNRVRDSHDALDGQVFSWDDPPMDEQLGETVIPGQAINCRCEAEPVLEDLFA